MLISAARTDTRITGAAVTGPAAVGREDLWSDIDPALCVTADADHGTGDVLSEWVSDALLIEAERIDTDLAKRLTGPLGELAG